MLKTLLVSVFLAASLMLTACNSSDQPSSTPPAASGSPHTETDISAPQTEPQKLERFDSVKIDVLAADIYVVPGDGWSISYQLSEKEPLDHFGVEGSTLYFETSFDSKEYFDRNEDWFVTVTVPANSPLSKLELETLSGNVEIRGFSCDTAELSSISGKVDAQDISAQTMELESTSGDITTVNLSAGDLEAETVSSDLCIAGIFNELDLHTVSGDTEAAGSISGKASLESTSGNISLSVSHAISLQANSFGTITLNGSQSKGPVSVGSGTPVNLESFSGDLIIQNTSSV